MIKRLIQHPTSRSFFVFGPRGTGKSSWLQSVFPDAVYLDLLDDGIYRALLSYPENLINYIKPESDWIILDEVQKIPELLNAVHRLIENKKIKFILSGSSARKLKSVGVNLLAGRAATRFMFPFTVQELGGDFDLEQALNYGMLPAVWDKEDPKDYLKSYVTTYLKEEVQQEGLSRNLGTFSRFLEIASFSQAASLNVSEVAREVGVDNKTAENYFTILEDLLLATRIPVFSKHAKRQMYQRPKFLFFDVGVYRIIRPKGPLDSPESIDGSALETLLFQELRALNEYHQLEFQIYYWRTSSKLEIDFILYGERGIIAIEVKRTANPRTKDFKALKAFNEDYPMARRFMFYGGSNRQYVDGIELITYLEGLKGLLEILGGKFSEN